VFAFADLVKITFWGMDCQRREYLPYKLETWEYDCDSSNEPKCNSAMPEDGENDKEMFKENKQGSIFKKSKNVEKKYYN